MLALSFGVGSIYADHGSDSQSGSSDGGSTTTTTTNTDSNTSTSEQESGSGSGSQDSGTSSTPKTENETESQNGTNEDGPKTGAQILAEMHKNHKDQTEQQRQKKCEAHKQGLTTKFSRIVTNSQRIQDRISGILDKAVAYQQNNNVQVTNFDTLVAAAQSAKTTSADSITALKTVTPSLDCNNVSVASDVANFKAAAQTTRSDLKAYKTAVQAVLQALENAKDQGSTQQ